MKLSVKKSSSVKEKQSIGPFSYKLVSLAVAAGLSCQAMAAEEQQADEEQEDSAPVVTIIGSHIKRATDIGTLPVTTISAEDIKDSAAITGDELLRTIPQVGEIAFGAETGNGGVNDARGDVASINLRGVGTGNTLTLLNGRRLVTHPGTQSENFVPVSTVNANTLPVAGLRSLQVLRDGAAAIYGSDAVAGVINYQLDDDYDGSKISLTYGGSEGTSLDEMTFNYLTGFDLNEGRTHVTASFSYYDRNGMQATERPYSASHDLREYPGLPEAFVGDTQLDNRSTSTPWGEFSSATLGTFHIQPDTMSGCVQDLGNGICADSGSLSRDLRYDRGAIRSMTSDVDRLNFYTYLTHDLGGNKEFFAEAIFYNATANRIREQTHNLTAQRFQIAANAAFNPFGEQVSLRRYRPVDTGLRDIEVEDTSFRILGGMSGSWGEWDWESAIFHTEAETNDLARNRIRASAFQAAVNSTDPNVAYNIFNGADINNPNTADNTLNPQSVMTPFLVDVRRDSETSLSQIDFKTSNDAIWSIPTGEIGVALGVEFRHETFEDDRDDLLDGSTPFVDQISGVELSGSDVWGSSPTPDSKGSRDVTSAYVEFLVPLLDSGTQYAEVQLAARYEKFSDVGDALKPKVAFFYEPAEWISLRASYAGGFRAPGLPQVTAEGVPRSNSLYDPVLDSTYGIVDVRSGTTDLEPEDDTNTSFGIVLQPLDDLTITVDSWKIEQEDLVGILAGSSHLLYDSLLRSQGSSNPAVVRDATTNEVIQINNDYLNLGIRNIEGIDFSVAYDWETSFGEWGLTLNAAKLTKFDQEADPISAMLIAAQEAGNPAVPADRTVAGAGDLIEQNGRPELRARISLNWKYDQWGAGINSNYVSEVTDTSTTATVDGEVITLPVDSFNRINVYADYRFQGDNFMKDSRVRVGVRNIEDNDPPLADELAHGYFGSLHSNRGRYFYVTYSKEF
ncbi:TonB-dependent receptor domain-containing protein [Aliikangiella coralliicola]|uniref:TonB-dependent receptor n=1 Tax=Aliikangiella coralliicola TaxID=2592383 RepID=A0A545UCI3_9GAMM|nr:TonB-dependent receptor [Aliikangiella coralliicola]TQV87174.1 TonB-dependent receptor [Aliikangiella coralliicola]